MLATREQDEWTVKRTRVCPRGHRQTTYEVMASVWGTARHRNTNAVATAGRRAALDTRNRAIVADLLQGRVNKVVAIDHGVSPSTVSLVWGRHVARDLCGSLHLVAT